MEQVKSDHKLLTDFWNFWRDHVNIEPLDTDPYWDKLLDDADKFARAHPDPYARVLIVSLLKEFERRAKEKE